MKKPFVVGVGNTGINIAVNIAKVIQADVMAVGVDALSLQQSGLANTLLLDKNELSGQQASPSLACLEWVFSGEENLVLTAGLEDEFAIKVLPIMVKLAEVMRIPTLVAVSLPLNIEEVEKRKLARICLEKIKKHSSNVVVLDQGALSLNFAYDETGESELFYLINQKITEEVIGKLA